MSFVKFTGHLSFVNSLTIKAYFLDESIPNSQGRAQQANGRGANIRNNSEPRKKYLASGSSDEDPYSLTPSGSSGSSGKVDSFTYV